MDAKSSRLHFYTLSFCMSSVLVLHYTHFEHRIYIQTMRTHRKKKAKDDTTNWLANGSRFGTAEFQKL